MNARRSYLAGLGLVAVSVLISVLAYPEMPAEMATNWNTAGEANDQMPKTLALALFPALSAGLLGLFAVLPKIDPLGENIGQFREQYDTFVVLLLAFLVYVHLVVVAVNAGYDFGVVQALAPAIGVLYYYVGALSEHAEQNWFVGIRTPWTLSNEQVWNQTHERAAPLFKISGGIAALGALAPAYAELLFVAPVAGVALYATVYSFVAYRRVTG